MTLNELREFLELHRRVRGDIYSDYHKEKDMFIDNNTFIAQSQTLAPLAVAKLIEAVEMLRSGKDTLLFVIDEEASTELMNKWISKVANFLSEFEEVQDDPNQI